MLRSISRNTSFFKAFIIFCLLLLIRAHTFVEKAKIANGHKYSFNWDAFLMALLLCVIVFLIIFFYLKIKTKVFWVDKNEIRIKFFLRKTRLFLLSDITAISWGSNDTTVTSWAGKRSSVSSRNDFIRITFNKEFILNFGINEYKNFDELRAWFLTYGRNNGIIKVEPINNRGRG